LLPGQIIPGAVATIVGAPVTVQGQPVQVRLPDTTVDVPVQVRGTPAPAPDNLVYVPVSAPQPVAVSIPVQIVGPTLNGRYYKDTAGSCYDSFTQQPTTPANCVVATTTAVTSCSPGYVFNGVTCVLTNAISCSPGYVSNGVTCVLANTISCQPGYVSNGVTCVLANTISCQPGYVSNGVTCVLANTIMNTISCPAGFVSNGVTCVLSSSVSSTRYYRDSRGQCLDTLQNNAPVLSALCGFRRSSHTAAESSQAIPLVTALSVCGGLTVVVALVASGVVLVRRTVSKRVEMRLAAGQ